MDSAVVIFNDPAKPWITFTDNTVFFFLHEMKDCGNDKYNMVTVQLGLEKN